MPQVGAAEGALAVGVTDTDDFYGVATGYDSAAKARQVALEECDDSSCRVVSTFHKKCASVAFAADGVDGFGWAVASNRDTAQRQAMSKCRSSSDEPDTCHVVEIMCD
jgi:hypothetical protein